MSIDKRTSILFLTVAIVGILLLTLSYPFYYHLRVDHYGQYIDHVKSFLQNHNLAHLGYNEYQPVAILFFVALSPFYVLSNLDITQYVYGLYLVNIILIVAAAFLIYALKRNYTNVFLFGLVLLLTGPIVLNRFELLVFVLLLLSFFSFSKQHYFWSGLFMAVAILTKIYPVIFVPYMFYVIFKNRASRHELPIHLSGYIAGAAAVLFVFSGILQADLGKMFSDLNIQAIKPVHVESLWSSLITLFQWAKNGTHIIGGGATGIYGILEGAILLPKWFFNYFWVIPVTAYYLSIIWKSRTKESLQFEVKHLYILALIFLVTSKILAPQYLLWFALLFCLIDLPEASKQRAKWSLQLFFILLASTMTQYIYPLNYDGLIAFYQNPDAPQIVFWITALRNFSLLALLFVSLKSVNKTNQ